MENVVDMLGGKLLSYGVSGFALLMIGFTYYLMKTELKREEPRQIAVKTIWMFMGLVILSTLVVGFFSLPLANKNEELNDEVNNLTVDMSKLMAMLTKYEYALNDLAYKLDNAKDPSPVGPPRPPRFNGPITLDTSLIAKYVDYSKLTMPKTYKVQEVNASVKDKLKQDVGKKVNLSELQPVIDQ